MARVIAINCPGCGERKAVEVDAGPKLYIPMHRGCPMSGVWIAKRAAKPKVRV